VETDKLRMTVALLISITMCIVAVLLVGGLLVGLFFTQIDGTLILRIIQPAFQTIIGGFIGFLTGFKLSR